jgi:hypothetical protein
MPNIQAFPFGCYQTQSQLASVSNLALSDKLARGLRKTWGTNIYRCYVILTRERKRGFGFWEHEQYTVISRQKYHRKENNIETMNWLSSRFEIRAALANCINGKWYVVVIGQVHKHLSRRSYILPAGLWWKLYSNPIDRYRIWQLSAN